MKYTYIFANTISDGDTPYISGVIAETIDEAIERYLTLYDDYDEGTIQAVIEEGIHRNDYYFEGHFEDFAFSVKRMDYFLETSMEEC